MHQLFKTTVTESVSTCNLNYLKFYLYKTVNDTFNTKFLFSLCLSKSEITLPIFNNSLYNGYNQKQIYYTNIL